eukprot:1328519-Rhodomonas_salina.1
MEMLPTPLPVVTDSVRDPAEPWEIRQRKTVSDSHRLDSQAVWPNLARVEACVTPIPDPCMVTECDPVRPTFVVPANLTAATPSKDTAIVLLPDCWATVVEILRLPELPCPEAMHRVDVEEVHEVAWQAVSPIRTEPLDACEPKPLPKIETLVEPVIAKFALAAELTVLLLKEKTWLVLPAFNPTVIATFSDRAIPFPLA